MHLDQLEITHHNPSGTENILHKLGTLPEIKITQGKALLCFHLSMPTGSAGLSFRLKEELPDEQFQKIWKKYWILQKIVERFLIINNKSSQMWNYSDWRKQ